MSIYNKQKANEIIELMKSRHSVRKYQDKPIEQEKREILNNYISKNLCGTTRIVACFDEPKAFENPDVHYGWFVNAKNYFVLIGPKGDKKWERELGFNGEKLVLKSQQLGLNTCWVALTYDKEKVPVELKQNEEVFCVITVGYGFKNGHERPSKTPNEVICCQTENAPEWFDLAVEACLLAPTARNWQRFLIVNNGNGYEPEISEDGPYAHIDIGIIKCHFELIEGKTEL